VRDLVAGFTGFKPQVAIPEIDRSDPSFRIGDAIAAAFDAAQAQKPRRADGGADALMAMFPGGTIKL
jgi:hypothetical protein